MCACLGVGAALLLPWRHVAGRGALSVPVQAAATSDDTFRRVWSAALPGVKAAALSPDGQYAAILYGGSSEKVSLWRWPDRPLKALWTRAEVNMSQVMVTAGGGSVITWARRDPTQPMVNIRRGVDGVCPAPLGLDGAVWDVQTAPDGQHMAFATGAHSLYMMTLGDRPMRHQWSLPGVGMSLVFSSDSAAVLAATWDASGLFCYSTAGASLWQYPAPAVGQRFLTGRVFEMRSACGGSSLLGVSYTNVRHGEASLYVWHGTNESLPDWHYALGPDAYQPYALLTANGKYVVAAYRRLITRGEETLMERRLALLDTQEDHPVWEQGNLLFSPQLVALSPDGERITVSDGARSLYNLNRQGRITSSYLLPGRGVIRQISATPNGRFILILTSDGVLSLMQVGSDTP